MRVVEFLDGNVITLTNEFIIFFIKKIFAKIYGYAPPHNKQQVIRLVHLCVRTFARNSETI